MSNLSVSLEVREEVQEWIEYQLPFWKETIETEILPQYEISAFDDEASLQITFGTTTGKGWGYQTGDNSFTGGAYGHLHWAVVYALMDSTVEELFEEVINQWEELLAQENDYV